MMRKTTLSRVRATSAVAAAAIVLAACGSGETDQSATDGAGPADVGDSWDAVVESAKEEGMVRVYSIAVPAQNDGIVAAFEEAYPEIEIDMVRGAGELPARVDAEIAGGTDAADVFINAGQQWYLDNAEHVLDIEGPASESWPDDAWVVEGKVPELSYAPAGFITWNTDIFPDGFSDWDDLTADDVHGKLGVPDQIHLYSASLYQFLEDNQGEDYLPALAQQDPRFYSSVVPMTQAVGSGEIGVSIMSTAADVIELKETGAPVDYVFPEQTWSTLYPAAALAHSPRANAAVVFVDFMMSPEGQAGFNGNGYAGSPLEGVEGTVDISGMTVVDAETFPPSRVEEWQSKWSEIFQ